MALLAKHVLLGANKPPQETVSIPELGGEVILRGMTGAERDAFEVSLVQGRGRNREVNLKNLRAKLVAYCWIDEHGERVCGHNETAALGDVRADVLSRMYTVAQRLSGITEEDADELGRPGKEISPIPSVSDTSSSVSPGSSV